LMLLGVAGEGRLKREIGWFSAFSMGYGDVGADVFIALGITALYAGGASLLAFAIAATSYVAISLAYAELAPTYPYAGGVQVYSLRAWDTLWSFMAGWAILLDYILCTSLFAAAAAGYIKFLVRGVEGLYVSIGPLEVKALGLIAAAIVLFLTTLNYFGIKYSAEMNAGIVAFGLAVQAAVLAVGFVTFFDVSRLSAQLLELGNPEPLGEVAYPPWLGVREANFLYGLTIAMASFIGVESISQAAEETRRPHRWIPRATMLCAATVPLFVLLFSSLASGGMYWREFSKAIENPVASFVARYPLLGSELAFLVSLTAVVLCTVSSNTGVIGVSRLAASMGRLGLLPRWLCLIHPKYGTPTRTIVLFGLIGLALVLPGDIPFLASLYNFGASLSYIMLLLALIVLRNKEPMVYRPWRMRPSIVLRMLGRRYEVPLIALIGLIIVSAIFVLFLMLHGAGRLLGPAWMAIGIATYYVYRRLALRKPLRSTEEKGLVLPAGYMMHLTILVRPGEDPRSVGEAIRHSLDKRFSLKLLSIVDPDYEGDVERARIEAERSLEEVQRILESNGFESRFEVRVGGYVEVVDEEVGKGESDFIALLVRRFEKVVLQKESILDSKIHSILHKYPGRVILLRKMT